MNTLPNNTEILSELSASMLWLPGLIVVLFFIFCWVLCIAAAFMGIQRTTFHASMVSLGIGGAVAFLAASVLSSVAPDLAREFTLPGLLFFSYLCVAPVVCVPLIEYAWDTTYKQGFASILLAFGMFFFVWSVFHNFLEPESLDAARISLPELFQPDA